MIVEVKSLEKSYHTGLETIHVLRNVDLRIEPGTTVVISGESGSGKTTLLSLLGGLDSISGGSITVNNRDITNLSEDELTEYRSKTIGFIFQFHFLLKDFTAFENVMIPSLLAGEKAVNYNRRAAQLLEAVGLEERGNHYPAELSGGEKQRIAVARALMNDPQIILADEPTGNLDEKNSSLVENLLFDLVDRYQKTLIMVTHDRSLAARGELRFELAHGVLAEQ